MLMYRRIFRDMLPEWRRISALAVVILLLVGLSALQAWPMALLIDLVASGHAPKFLTYFCGDRLESAITLLVAGFFLIKLLQDGLSLCRSMITLRIKYTITQRVRQNLYRHIQVLGHVHFKSHAQGDTIFRVMNDAYGPYGVFDTVLTTLQALGSLGSILAVMWTRNSSLTLFAISMGPFLALANWHFGRKIKRGADESRRVDASLMTAIQRSLSTLVMTQLCVRQKSEEQRFDAVQTKSVDAALSLNWQENLYPFTVQTLYGLGQGLILAGGAWLVISSQRSHGAQPLTTGDLVLFVTYFNQILDPMSLIFGFGARVKGSIAATERVFSLLDEKPAVIEAQDAHELDVKPRDLTIDKVWFAHHPERNPVLCGLSSKIKIGQMVALVGPSGSGKSTLMSLLARFHDPSAGGIFLDGFDLKSLSLNAVRRHIAVVSQDSMLLPGTILENIRYGNPHATEAQVRVAAAQAGADLFIEQLPQGYLTEAAEGGQNFSGGQRQRIAIARALLAEAPILILDEPTSALDGFQEQGILSHLKALRGRTTIILITHRLNTVSDCDQILVMRHGRIFEQGTHEELLSQGGLYPSMLNATPAET